MDTDTQTYTQDDRAYAADVATTIRTQFPVMGLMTLGADMKSMRPAIVDDMPALAFIARILPFRKDGQRSERPAKMTVAICLAGDDTYTAIVTHRRRDGSTVEHARVTGIYADQLDRLALALDYDGDTALNPRYL